MSINFPPNPEYPTDPVPNGTPWTDTSNDPNTDWIFYTLSGWHRIPGSVVMNDPNVFPDQSTGSITLGALSTWMTGELNTIVGMTAGTQISTGRSNVIFGSTAGELVTAGNNNVLIGTEAVKTTAGILNNNVIIGNTAQSTLPDADSCVLIGSAARTGGTNNRNQIVIGSAAVGLGEGIAVIGDSTTIAVVLEGAVQVASYDITALPDPAVAGRIIYVTGRAGTGGYNVHCTSTGVRWDIIGTDTEVT